MLTRTLIGASLLALGLAGCGGSPPPAAHTPPAATPAAAPAAPARAAPPSVADLVGARAAGGESDLQARGYTAARTRGLTAYWWHPGGACVRVVTANGRYSTVQPAAAAECGH